MQYISVVSALEQLRPISHVTDKVLDSYRTDTALQKLLKF